MCVHSQNLDGDVTETKEEGEVSHFNRSSDKKIALNKKYLQRQLKRMSIAKGLKIKEIKML